MDDRQYIKELESRCDMAVKKIERLTTEVEELRNMFRWLAGRYSTHTNHCQTQEYVHPHELENLARYGVSDSQKSTG